MALFRFSTEPPTRPLIRTENLILRAPQVGDYAAWSLLRIESRAFLTPWEPVWNEDDLTRNSFRLRVKRAAREIASDEAYSLFVLDARSEMLLGGLTLGLVRRGVAQACTLGYWMGARHAGKGHMSEAVRGALRKGRVDAITGRDAYWNCLAREYPRDSNKAMSDQEFTALIANVCPSERQNFRVSLIDFLSLQFPKQDADANLSTANRAIELAQKDIVIAFVRRRAAAK